MKTSKATSDLLARLAELRLRKARLSAHLAVIDRRIAMKTRGKGARRG